MPENFRHFYFLIFIYLLYLSQGKETYIEIAQKSWQIGSINAQAFGVSSIFIPYRGEDGNMPYFKILKEGKLIEIPFDGLYSNKQKDKKAYADADLVEANNLVYTAYAKAEEAVVVEKPKAKAKSKK